MALTAASNTYPDATTHVQVANVIQSGAGPFQQDVAITPATLADGTLRMRLDPKAYPQKGKKLTGTHASWTVGDTTVAAEPLPATARPTHGSGS